LLPLRVKTLFTLLIAPPFSSREMSDITANLRAGDGVDIVAMRSPISAAQTYAKGDLTANGADAGFAIACKILIPLHNFRHAAWPRNPPGNRRLSSIACFLRNTFPKTALGACDSGCS